eukprot:7213516-Pyramimonas_sp.AAC.1
MARGERLVTLRGGRAHGRRMLEYDVGPAALVAVLLEQLRLRRWPMTCASSSAAMGASPSSGCTILCFANRPMCDACCFLISSSLATMPPKASLVALAMLDLSSSVLSYIHPRAS